MSEEDRNLFSDRGWLPVWLELDERGRLRNFDPTIRDDVMGFYVHPVGTARSFGYCGA